MTWLSFTDKQWLNLADFNPILNLHFLLKIQLVKIDFVLLMNVTSVLNDWGTQYWSLMSGAPSSSCWEDSKSKA